MTIDYAMAYTKERLARADSKRLMRQAIHGQKVSRGASSSLRAGVGRRLISVGEQLLGVHALEAPALRQAESSR